VKILVSLLDELYVRIQAVIPPRQRSKVVLAGLLEDEVQRREKELYQCVLAVEQDQQLQANPLKMIKDRNPRGREGSRKEQSSVTSRSRTGYQLHGCHEFPR
jgi:hypothetical protein